MVTLVGSEAHGHQEGHRVYIDFASGIADGWFTIPAGGILSTTSFSVNSTGADVVSPVNAILTRRSIRQVVNVQSVPYNSSFTSDLTVNLATSYGSTNYLILGTVQSDISELLGFYRLHPANAVKTALYFNFFTAGTGTGNRYNSAEVNVAIF